MFTYARPCKVAFELCAHSLRFLVDQCEEPCQGALLLIFAVGICTGTGYLAFIFGDAVLRVDVDYSDLTLACAVGMLAVCVLGCVALLCSRGLKLRRILTAADYELLGEDILV